MSQIVEELERQGIVPTYDNIAIYAVFASSEGLVGKLMLDNSEEYVQSTELKWLESLFTE